MNKKDDPYYMGFIYCGKCDAEREDNDYEFLGLIEELGNIPRYKCNICGNTFESLPPCIMPDNEDDETDE